MKSFKHLFLRALPITALFLSLMLVITSCTTTTTTNNNDNTQTGNATETGGETNTGGVITPPGITLPNLSIPNPLIYSRSTLRNTEYVVFAWNDLGMHCANPSYNSAVLLPPYNDLWAQVIKRGDNPQVVTSGLTVEYTIIDNTYSYGKGNYSQFWDNAQELFGTTLDPNTGLNLSDPNVHNGLSGTMVIEGDHFEAVGIPLTPVNDDGTWNPYQVSIITVKDSSGNILAQTNATLPVSDEINCARCHGDNPFQDVLEKHDSHEGTDLVNQKPVLCASCHGDPALGTAKQTGINYLSEAMHGFHSTASPQPTCQNCHPGEITKCNRSIAHTTADGNCIECHGDLAQVSGSITSGRMPWGDEPKCATCHTSVAEVDTGSTLYRNATGHGDVYCASCHSSPHAMVPATIFSDNYQALQYQGAEKTIGSCGVCHSNSRGQNDIFEYGEVHAGSNPEVYNACFICHTSVSTNTSEWPHSYRWTDTGGVNKTDEYEEEHEREDDD